MQWSLATVLFALATSPAAGQCLSPLAAPGSDDPGFGWSAAIDGDRLLVGTVAHDRAYVFERSPTGWDLDAVLESGITLDPPVTINVALVGDTAFVASRRWSATVWAIYVYERVGASWTQTDALYPPAPYNVLGDAMDVEGDTLVVGADRAAGSGRAYVYVRDAGTWTLDAVLQASDGSQDDRFGAAVAIDGDRIVVGANFADLGAQSWVGKAYVFERTGSAWTETQVLVPTQSQHSGAGSAVDVRGDTLVVGAHNDSPAATSHPGAAHVYEYDGAVWQHTAELFDPAALAHGRHGQAVALVDESNLLVGAPLRDVGTQSEAGRVYEYARVGTTWQSNGWHAGPDPFAGQAYGSSLAWDGTTLVVSNASAQLPPVEEIYVSGIAVGQRYCPAQPNSTGSPGRIDAFGCDELLFGQLRLRADNLPAGQFGYFIASRTQAQSPGPHGGVVCVGGAVGRFNRPQDIVVGPTGSLIVDLENIPIFPPVAVQPGDTWNFQCWFRDVAADSNYTDATSITFQ
ncbi:MAG: hypothetical protein GY711_19390 [bacterium]|nr:hypothetical protein [bacterium]